MRIRPFTPGRNVTRLHWKLFFPLIGLSWLIIGTTICYFVAHERQRLKYNLENQLLNVNSTVIEAYETGADLQSTVDFIKLFTDQTTLAPLRITVYACNGKMVADNKETTIRIFDKNGNIIPEFKSLWDNTGGIHVHDIDFGRSKFMICSKTSSDGRIHSFAALPYNEEVTEFLGIDPMIWVVVLGLGILSSALVYLGARAICRNVYALRDFAEAISTNRIPENVDSWDFSDDELGEVSRKLLMLYREKLHAEYEKAHHERQIGMNISHELNTPISIIKGYIDTILITPDMPEDVRTNFLVRAQQGTDRLIRLIDDVNTVMRLQETGNALECEKIRFRDIVAQLSRYINHDNIAAGMRFVGHVPDDCMVTAHESLLMNALLNLTYNAARYSEGTLITLEWLREENGREVFSYSDNGVGVAEEHLERLFDMFYRVDSGRTRKRGGTGLGLPLVKKIITAMDGDIFAKKAAGGGLEFIFTLPKGA